MNYALVIAQLNKVLLESHQYHQEKGLLGCDPRLYWNFPAYRYSLKNNNLWTGLARKIETLSYKTFPKLIDIYKRIYGIDDVVSPYGIALFISTYVNMYELYDDKNYLSIAKKYSEILNQLFIVTKSGNIGISSPLEGASGINLPGGAEAALAMLDLYNATGDKCYFDWSEKIADAFLYDFNIKKISTEKLCLDYTVANDGRYVLNANALAAGVMSAVSEISKTRRYDKIINGIVLYIKDYLPMDEIPYAGVEDKLSGKTYDVYHTGFTLRGLHYVIKTDKFNSVEIELMMKKSVQRLRYDFLNRKNYVKALRSRPVIDVHGVAEYIRVLSKLDFRVDDIPVFLKNIEYMYAGGTFYYERGFVDIYRYLPRWGHAPMMLAITSLLLKIRNVSCTKNSLTYT